MAKTKLITHVSGEHFTHRTLWHGAQVLYQMGQNEAEGSFYPILAASLFAYLAFEGYLNYLGAKAYPDVWEDERKFFSGGNYRGTLGKLQYIAEDLHVALKKDEAPYQTIRILNARRDYLVHAKTEVLDEVVSYSEPSNITNIEAEIYSFGDSTFVKRALADVENLADQLHDAARIKYGDEAVVFDLKAFIGMHSHQFGWVK